MIAKGIVYDLLKHGHGDIIVLDSNAKALEDLRRNPMINSVWREGVKTIHQNVFDMSLDLLRDREIVFSTLPYQVNNWMMRAAIDGRCNWIDLGGNNAEVQKQIGDDKYQTRAKEAGVTIVPDFGLAPGLATPLARRALYASGDRRTRPSDPFSEEPLGITVSVGGLPTRLDNALKYQIVFSPHGLVNEYIEPVEILHKGKLKIVPGMSYCSQLSVGLYQDLEHFYTSGGISTYARHLAGDKAFENVSLEYRTIRYDGHCEKMKTMLDLFVPADREGFENLLAKACPAAGPDMILIKVTAIKGWGNEVYNLESITYGDEHLSAMAKMTAFPVTILGELIVGGEANRTGIGTYENMFSADIDNRIINELKERGITFTETGNAQEA